MFLFHVCIFHIFHCFSRLVRHVLVEESEAFSNWSSFEIGHFSHIKNGTVTYHKLFLGVKLYRDKAQFLLKIGKNAQFKKF